MINLSDFKSQSSGAGSTASIFSQMSEFDTTIEGAGHFLTEETVEGNVYARISGSSTTTWAYFHQEIDLTNSRHVRIKIRKDPTATSGLAIRVTDRVNAFTDLVVSPVDGSYVTDDSLLGSVLTVAELVTFNESAEHYEYIIKFNAATAPATPSSFVLIPDHSILPALTNDVNAVGSIDILELDFDYVLSSLETVETLSRTSRRPTGGYNNTNNGQYIDASDVQFNQGNGFSVGPNNGIAGLKAGKTYRYDFYARVSVNSAGMNANIRDIATNTTIDFTTLGFGNSGINNEYGVCHGYFTPSVDTELALLITGASANVITIADANFTVEEVPTTESVLANSIIPQSLARLHLRKYEATVNTGFQSFSSYNVSDESDTLGRSTERVDLSSSQKSIDANGDFTVNQFSTTVNKDIDRSKVSVILGFRWEDSEQFEIIPQLVINDVVQDFRGVSDGNANTDQVVALSYTGSLSQGDVVDVRFIKQNGDNDSDTITIQSIILDIEEEPSSKVVNPRNVSVEDVEIIEGNLNTLTNATSTTVLDNGRTWNNLIADYEYLRFEFITVNGGIDHVSSVTVKTTNLSNGVQIRALDGSGGNFSAQLILDQAFTTGNATADVPTWSAASISVVGIKPQKTVITNNVIEVTGGNGTSGQSLKSNADGTASFADDYVQQDIGGFLVEDRGILREMSGRGTTDVAGNVQINYPQPLAAGSSSINVTAANNSSVTMHYDNDNTTGFAARARDHNNNGVATSFSWRVIGLKP